MRPAGASRAQQQQQQPSHSTTLPTEPDCGICRHHVDISRQSYRTAQRMSAVSLGLQLQQTQLRSILEAACRTHHAYVRVVACSNSIAARRCHRDVHFSSGDAVACRIRWLQVTFSEVETEVCCFEGTRIVCRQLLHSMLRLGPHMCFSSCKTVIILGLLCCHSIDPPLSKVLSAVHGGA